MMPYMSRVSVAVFLACVVHIMICDALAQTRPAPQDYDPRARSKVSTTQPSASYKAILPHGAPADQPQIELQFVKISLTGEKWPVFIEEMNGFRIASADGKWSSAYGPGATGLRLASGSEQTLRQLVQGNSYKIQGLPLSPDFVVPMAQPGQVSRIELIVDDERLVQLAPPAPEVQAIHGSTANLKESAGFEVDDLAVIYHKGKIHVSTPLDAEGAFEVPNATALGGELAIASRSASLAVAYCSSVEKWNLRIPEDADWILSKQRLRTVRIRYDRKNLPENAKIISLHLSRESVVPVAWFALSTVESGAHKPVPTGKWVIKSLTKPGEDPEFVKEITITDDTSELIFSK